jgi:hypothetical protein
MARTAHDREDLLRDARALTPRVQFRVQIGDAESTIVAGFRGESLSLYFDDDPAFHFNSLGELRRAFIADRVIKADNGRLVVMTRVRADEEVVLQAEILANSQQEQLLTGLARRLAEIEAALESGAATIDGQVPADGDAIKRMTAWLALHRHPTIAASPRVR